MHAVESAVTLTNPPHTFINEWASPPETARQEESDSDRMVMWSQMVVVFNFLAQE